MKLTLAFLRSISLPQSYDRGEDYYHNGVISKLIKQGDEYTAEVWGSYRYKVWIGLGNEQFESTCNCPYDYSGPCKHVVAVGLGIINEEFDEIIEAVELNQDKSVISEQDFFEMYYAPTHPTQKEVFLNQLLRKDVQLREQFIQFINVKDELIVKVNIDSVAQKVTHVLEQFDLTEDSILSYWEEPSSYDTYGEESRDIEDAIERMLTTKFESYEHEIESYIEQGRPDEALRVLLGLYEGIHQAELNTDYYEDESIFIANSFVDKHINKIISYLKRAVVSVKNASSMIYLIFERWDKRKKDFIPHGQTKFQYDLVQFIPLWQALASDIATAQALRLRLEAYTLYSDTFAELYLHIAFLQKDDTLKLKIMIDFALSNLKIGLMLFDHYFKKNQKVQALDLAKDLFGKWPDQISRKFLPIISIEDHRDLHISMLKHLASLETSLEKYMKLKEFISLEETKEFVKNQQNKTIYYIEILSYEEDFETILAYAQENIYALGNKSLDFILTPILNVYPKFCYDLLTARISQLEGARGRSVYREICGLLNLLNEINAFKKETDGLISALYSQRLPALKDEMRHTGLV